MAFHFDPQLKSGRWAKTRAGRRFHICATESARFTECGTEIDQGSPATYPPGPTVYLEAVCRRCAERHLEVLLALRALTR